MVTRKIPENGVRVVLLAILFGAVSTAISGIMFWIASTVQALTVSVARVEENVSTVVKVVIEEKKTTEDLETRVRKLEDKLHR